MAKKTNASFEVQMERLLAIVQELERADLPLEKNVALYKEGKTLVAACNELLENAKNEIMLCTEEGEKPFTLDSEDGDE